MLGYATTPTGFKSAATITHLVANSGLVRVL